MTVLFTVVQILIMDTPPGETIRDFVAKIREDYPEIGCNIGQVAVVTAFVGLRPAINFNNQVWDHEAGNLVEAFQHNIDISQSLQDLVDGHVLVVALIDASRSRKDTFQHRFCVLNLGGKHFCVHAFRSEKMRNCGENFPLTIEEVGIELVAKEISNFIAEPKHASYQNFLQSLQLTGNEKYRRPAAGWQPQFVYTEFILAIPSTPNDVAAAMTTAKMAVDGALR